MTVVVEEAAVVEAVAVAVAVVVAAVVGEAEASGEEWEGGVSDLMHGVGVSEATSSILLVAMIFTGTQKRLKLE